MIIRLHPRRRTPGRSPNAQVRIYLTGSFNIRNQNIPVTVDIKIHQIKVSCNIRRRVKTHGKVISSHRKTTIVEASSIFAKDSLKNSFTIFSRQGIQRIPTHFIEAATYTRNQL